MGFLKDIFGDNVGATTGTLIGGGIGAAVAGPPGAAVGAGIGGTIGSSFDGSDSNQDRFPFILDKPQRGQKFGFTSFLASQPPILTEMQAAALFPYIASQLGITDPTQLADMFPQYAKLLEVTGASPLQVPQRSVSPEEQAYLEQTRQLVGFNNGQQQGLDLRTPFGPQANVLQNALFNLSLGQTFDPFTLQRGSLDQPSSSFQQFDAFNPNMQGVGQQPQPPPPQQPSVRTDEDILGEAALQAPVKPTQLTIDDFGGSLMKFLREGPPQQRQLDEDFSRQQQAFQNQQNTLEIARANPQKGPIGNQTGLSIDDFGGSLTRFLREGPQQIRQRQPNNLNEFGRPKRSDQQGSFGQTDILTGGRLPTAADIPRQAQRGAPTFGNIAGRMPQALPLTQRGAFGGLQDIINSGGSIAQQLQNLISGNLAGPSGQQASDAFKQSQLEQFDIQSQQQRDQAMEALNKTGALRSSVGANQLRELEADIARQRTALITGVDLSQQRRTQDLQSLALNRSLQALGLGTGVVGQDIGRRLQGAQQDVNAALGLGSFGLNRALGLGQLGLGAVQQDVNRGLGLGQLGLGAGQLINQQNVNQSNLLSILSGASQRTAALDFQTRLGLLDRAGQLGQQQTQFTPFSQFQQGIRNFGLLPNQSGSQTFSPLLTQQLQGQQQQTVANQQGLGDFFGGMTQFGLQEFIKNQNKPTTLPQNTTSIPPASTASFGDTGSFFA